MPSDVDVHRASVLSHVTGMFPASSSCFVECLLAILAEIIHCSY